MAHDIEHLKREIEELERQITSHPFEGLFDRKRLDQMQDKLKKKRKELTRLETGDGAESDDVSIPDMFAGVEVTSDMGPQMPVDLDIDERPVTARRTGWINAPPASPFFSATSRNSLSSAPAAQCESSAQRRESARSAVQVASPRRCFFTPAGS